MKDKKFIKVYYEDINVTSGADVLLYSLLKSKWDVAKRYNRLSINNNNGNQQLEVSTENLASTLKTTRMTIYRKLEGLKTKGLISTSKKGIKLFIGFNDSQNVNEEDSQNVNRDSQNVNRDSQNVNRDSQNVNRDSQNVTTKSTQATDTTTSQHSVELNIFNIPSYIRESKNPSLLPRDILTILKEIEFLTGKKYKYRFRRFKFLIERLEEGNSVEKIINTLNFFSKKWKGDLNRLQCFDPFRFFRDETFRAYLNDCYSYLEKEAEEEDDTFNEEAEKEAEKIKVVEENDEHPWG